MRLIDADALIDLVAGSSILSDGFKQAFCSLVAGEPTVDVQPDPRQAAAEDGYTACDDDLLGIQ